MERRYDNPGFAVAAGDVSAGQTVGSLDGMILDFTFTSNIPEPAALSVTGRCFVTIALPADAAAPLDRVGSAHDISSEGIPRFFSPYQ